MRKPLLNHVLGLFGLRVLRRTYPKRSYKKIVKKRIGIPVQKRNEALTLVTARLEYFNQYYRYSYNKISIKNQRTRWGSCSSKGNLNFNYRIIDLASELQDYLIVHELCHLKELNHSKQFWDLVAHRIPEYQRLRAVLQHTDAITISQ